MRRTYFISLITICLSASCKVNIDKLAGGLISGEYELKSDSLHVSEIILCSYFKTGFSGELQYAPLNNDSLKTIIENAFAKLSLPLKFHDDIQFSCETYFKENQKVKRKNYSINANDIKTIAVNESHRYTLVPFVFTLNNDIIFYSSSATGVTPIGGMRRHPLIIFQVYIFDYDELVFFRKYRVTSENLKIYYDNQGNAMNYFTDQPYVSPIQQKNWDKLVEKTMKDFIKRMKYEEKK